MLKGAVAWAKTQDVTLLEAYPMDKPDRAGFKEVARRKPQRPVVRLKVHSSSG